MENFPIDAQTKLLCLIGNPVDYSMSPIMHNAVIQKLHLNYIYLAFKVQPKELKAAIDGIKSLDIKGINVTLPYKEKILPYLDEIDPLARKIGAVNTIKNENGILKARNTDAAGSKESLLNAGCKISGNNILVLGAGGACRAICFMLAKNAEKIMISNRTKHRAISLAKEINQKMNIKAEGYSNKYSVLEKLIKSADILINTTPVGMYPDISQIPIPDNLLNENLFVFDAIYNPIKTKLLKAAEKKGCRILGGIDMLINQGALAFEWWTGFKADKTTMKQQILDYLDSNS